MLQCLTRRYQNLCQSLSDHIRIIFLTSPPINEEQLRKKLRYIWFLFSYIITIFYWHCLYRDIDSGVFTLIHNISAKSNTYSNEFLTALCSATQSGRTNESCGEYADALMELSEELNVKAINLWSAIQTRDDWLDVSFTWVHIFSLTH